MRIAKLLSAVAVASVSGILSLSSLANTHLGTAVQTAAFQREVTLAPDAKYLNVTWNETVKITIGGKSFVWRFDTLGTPNFDLGEIAPAGSNAKGIRVYVSPDPTWISG